VVGELRIFPSPKASIEGAKSRSRAYKGGGSQSLFRGGKLRIFRSPRAYINGGRGEKDLGIFLSPKAYIGKGQGEISEFLSPSLYRGG